MDVNSTHSSNRNNYSPSGRKVDERRPRLNRSFFSNIVKYIKSNPEPEARPEHIGAGDNLTSEAPSSRQCSPRKQLLYPESRDDFDQSTMKVKKSERVSDSFPQKETSGVTKNRPLQRPLKYSEAVAGALKSPLPDKKPPFHQERTNRRSGDGEPSSSKMFSRKSAEEFMERMSTVPPTAPKKIMVTVSSSSDVRSFHEDVQINEESDSSTSSGEVHESPEKVPPPTHKRLKSKDQYVHESFPAGDGATPVTDYTDSTSEDFVSKKFPFIIKMDSPCPSPPSESQPDSVSKREFHEGSKESPHNNNRKVLVCHEEKPLQLPDMSMPPPGFGGSYASPVTSRHSTSGKERSSRFSTPSPVPYDSSSRSRSCNRLGASSSQASSYQTTSRRHVIDNMTNWRSSPHHAESGGTGTSLDKNSESRRSYDSLLQEARTMTRASSSDSISIRSSGSESFLYHLSRETAEQKVHYQGYVGVTGTPAGYDRSSYFASPSYYNYYSPCSSPSLLPRQEADDPLEPNFRGHQLLGDSQLLRFSKQVLWKTSRSSGNMYFLGLCVSGQTIQDLLHKIKEKFYPVGERIVCMIGTNDFLRNHSLDDMTTAFDNLISHLLCNPSRKITLLTVPPIPRLADSETHKIRLKKFNTFIKGYCYGSEDVQVADISQLFFTNDRQCRMELFESTYDNGRQDLVHLNSSGFSVIQNFLIQNNYL